MKNWRGHEQQNNWCEAKIQTAIRLHALTRKTVDDTKFFISLFERDFQMMKNGVYFIVIAVFVAELFKKLEDLWRHKVDTKWCKITKKENLGRLSAKNWNFVQLHASQSSMICPL